jgi:hypothetical protein
MKRKQLFILLILVVVLGGIGYYLRPDKEFKKGGNPSVGKKLFGELPINDVSQITIKQATNELGLAKKDNLWRVRERNDYPANFADISEFLIKAKDIKIVQTETVGSSLLGRFALAPGQGTNSPVIVDLRDQGGKLIKSFLLGKKHMKKSDRPSQFGEMGEEGFPDGRYVKLNDSDAVSLISEPFSNLEPKADQWLNKDFFKIERIRSIAVTFPNATNSWKLIRETETGEWKLADAKPAEQLDAPKASGVSNPLGSPSFVDVATTSKPEDLGLDKPTVGTVETFDNFTYILKIGQKTNDNYPLSVAMAAKLDKDRTAGKDEKAEDKAKLDKEFKDKQKKLEEKLAQERAYEKWIYLVSSWTVDPLLKERSQLMAEKKEDKKDDAKKDQPTLDDTKEDEKPPIAPLVPLPKPDDSAKTNSPAPAPDTKPAPK